MLPAETVRHGQHVLTVCNSCRYCEGYCPVFPALERRLTFSSGDLAYLANLCHNCGECLYACQYAPPHEFGIDVPRTLADIRLRSYEDYCWPAFLGGAFRAHRVATALALAGIAMAMLLAGALAGGASLWPSDPRGEFYAVIPHHVMVGLFGGVGLFALAALIVGGVRFWRDAGPTPVGLRPAAAVRALREAATLRHLHTSGIDCTYDEEARAPWRRWCHHLTFYGFLLCFASTSVAAIYHLVFGWEAPHAVTSVPVLLGTAGGVGLVAGPAGLLALARRRDPALADPAQTGPDTAFIALLLLTSLTGLLLLVLRDSRAMTWLLVAHLGFVLALFVTLPYGKFVHGIYRTLALVRNAAEEEPQA